MRYALIASAVMFASVHADSAVAAVRAYHIGNSLTNQTTVHYQGFYDLAAAANIDYEWGRHIRCASSLPVIVANPDDVCVGPIEPYGTFSQALPNFEWDIVTLQYYGGVREEERGAFSTLTNLALQNPANADTKFYLFSAWPQGFSSDSYSTRWDAGYDAAQDSEGSRWTRGYATTLLSEVRADHQGTSINMIPAGEVLYRIDQLARTGKFDSFDSATDLYADSGHLDTDGAYISRLTWFATMFGQSPVGLPASPNSELTSADLLLVQQTVWDVVTTNSQLTGVPEPSALGVVAIVAAGLLRRRRQAI
jgi:hypothetical protein